MSGFSIDGSGPRVPLTDGTDAAEAPGTAGSSARTTGASSAPPPVGGGDAGGGLGQAPALPAPRKAGAVSADAQVSKPDLLDKLKAGWAKLKEDPRFQLAVKVFGIVSGAVALGMAIAATVAGGPIAPLVLAGISFAISAARHSGALEALFDKLGMSDQARKTTMIVLGLVMLGSGTGGAISHLAGGVAHGVAAGAAVLDSGRMASGIKGAYDTGNRQLQVKIDKRDPGDDAVELMTIADRSLRAIDAAGRQALEDHRGQMAQVQGGSGALSI